MERIRARASRLHLLVISARETWESLHQEPRCVMMRGCSGMHVYPSPLCQGPTVMCGLRQAHHFYLDFLSHGRVYSLPLDLLAHLSVYSPTALSILFAPPHPPPLGNSCEVKRNTRAYRKTHTHSSACLDNLLSTLSLCIPDELALDRHSERALGCYFYLFIFVRVCVWHARSRATSGPGKS